MRITYIKLENVAGLFIGSGRSEIEIDFSRSINPIVCIQGRNGDGKTTLLSSLTPFAYVTSLDERSSLPYILSGKKGYKEIRYQNGDDEIVVKHYFKPSGDTHSVKSYFVLNGEELNKTGNVTSFNSLVEIHFGLTQEMMRLIRLGSNVNSFVSLTPARRKEYIGKLIDEIDMYLQIHKKVNEDLRVIRVMMQTNTTNLNNCHISDLTVENERISQMRKDIQTKEKERDKLVTKIAELTALMQGNDVDDLKRKKREAEVAIQELDRTYHVLEEHNLVDTTVDSLIQKRSNLTDERIDTQAKVNSYRLSTDSALQNIDRLELMVKKITSDHDMQSLLNVIEQLKNAIAATPKFIREFQPTGITSQELQDVIGKLSNSNQIAGMIYTFGSKPTDTYLRLKKEKKSVDHFLKEQAKKVMNRTMNLADVQQLISQLFQGDVVITPNCEFQFEDCPYYRFATVLDEVKDQLEEESYDEETLRYIQIISQNLDQIFNDMDRLLLYKLPDQLKDMMTEKMILSRMTKRIPFFDLGPFHEYLSVLREYEIFLSNTAKLKDGEYQFSIYKKSGIESHLQEIKHQQESIVFYRQNIAQLNERITSLTQQLSQIDAFIALVTKYQDGKKYRKMFEQTLESTEKLLQPLESAQNEKMELEFQLRSMTMTIHHDREELRMQENRVHEYERLSQEAKSLRTHMKNLNIISESASTKKGIPVVYMQKYLGKIRSLANNLLGMIYDDSFRLAKFNVNADSFDIPYVKNGNKVPDIKYASQSEISLSTIALSFALMSNATSVYNIILLDEIEAGLDEENRHAFMQMLQEQMTALHAEQVFFISHNLSSHMNIPMDVIRLSETSDKSKVQNIIYQ